MSDKTFQCSECLLHYRTKEMAEKCQDYCKTNHACSLEIIQNSIENEKARLIHEN